MDWLLLGSIGVLAAALVWVVSGTLEVRIVNAGDKARFGSERDDPDLPAEPFLYLACFGDGGGWRPFHKSVNPLPPSGRGQGEGDDFFCS